MSNSAGAQSASDLCRAHLWITGRVQGVGYRYSTLKTATSQNLSGWVKNLADGRVEAVLEGAPSNVEMVIDWCHRGPAGAQVQAVRVEYEPPEELSGFRIHRDL